MDQRQNSPPEPAPPPHEAPLPPPRRRRKWLRYVVIGLVVVILLALGAWYYLAFIAPYESMDDAFFDGYIAYVAPRVSGQVIRLLITDNQWVNRGDALVEIDPRDFQTELAQAEADFAAASNRVAQARAQISVDEAKADQQRAAVAAAEAVASRSKADLRRYAAVPAQAVSRIQYDLAATQAKSSAADLEVARKAVAAAEAMLPLDQAAVRTAETQAEQSRAALQYAQLKLSYTKVVAPLSGWITHRTVDHGDYVQTGQALLAIVPSNVWVTANFKETQLTHMQPGQAATIHIDAYPQHEFKGTVNSLQAGTGARFSLLPPENAVGNFVKVVQRVPVKITFDEPLSTNMDLAPGLSVEAKVRVK